MQRSITASRPWTRLRLCLALGTLVLMLPRHTSAQSSAPASPKPDATVTDTRLGLENLELLQKGINPGAQGASLTPDQLMVTPELLKATPGPELPEKQDRDESTLRDLRRRQWSSENWLVDGMRRSELAEDEADLAEDALKTQSGSSRSAEDTSARARVEAGTSNEWLALAVETQQETEAEAQHSDAQDRRDASRSSSSASPSNSEGANPLGDFMAGWLSGDSRVMLSSAAERSPGSIGSLPAGAAEGGRIDELSLAQMRDPESRTKGVVPVADVGDAATTNPFLAFHDRDVGSDPRDFQSPLELLAPDAPVRDRAFQLGTMIPADSAPTSGNGSVTPMERLDEKPSEPWKPPAKDDEKYFPRLKRF